MKTRWIAGEETLRRGVEAFLDNPSAGRSQVLSESDYRRTLCLDLPALGQPVVVKEYRPAAARSTFAGRAIARLRGWFGHTSAEREWKALTQLREAGVPVPEPLAMAQRSGGGALVVTRFVTGAQTLGCRLDGDPFEKHRLLRNVGELVRTLHRAGYVHGDLHVGNILVGEKEPLLIDLQRVRRLERAGDRIRDIAFLDFSLHHAGQTRTNRMRHRIAALGLGPSRIAAERQLLREVGRASQSRALDYYDGRTRRTLRAGEGFCSVGCDEGRGMRVAAFPTSHVQEALTAHRRAVAQAGPALLKCDHRSNVSRVEVGDRSLVVKEVVKTSVRKRLADVLRGSPGRRAWVAGHGLLIRGIGATRPLAFVERRKRGIPVSSLVVLEDLGKAPRLADLGPDDRHTPDLPKHLLGLLLQLHRTCALHGDLQAIHVYLASDAGSTIPTLIDLEGVRFMRRLHDRHRIQMLAELNATIADEVMPARARRELLDRYLVALPFESGNQQALAEIVKRSLARGQRWQGTDCEISPRLRES